MNYELAYIIPLKYTETEIPKILAQVAETIKKTGATITKEENWGKKKIAYPIKQNRHGYFIITQINAQTENLAKINQELRGSPEILRHSIVKFKPGSFESQKKISKQPMPDILSTRFDESRRVPDLKSPTQKTQSLKPISKQPDPGLKKTTPKSKTTGKSKVALEDLDKKLDEILSDQTLNT